LLASASVVGSVSARAADLPVKAIPPTVPPFSWTGFYIGGNVGALRSYEGLDPICPTLVASCPLLFPGFKARPPPLGNFLPPLQGSVPGGLAATTSFAGGAQAGYNYQVNRFVVGIEADADTTHIRVSFGHNVNSNSFRSFVPLFTATLATNSTVSSDWMMSLRARVGFAWDRFMLYGTGGVAFSNVGVSTTFTYAKAPAASIVIGAPPVGTISSQNLAGWTAGVGGEWAVNKSASVAAEYRHSDFGSHSYLLGTDVAGAPIATGVTYRTDQVTLRLNWHWAGK
jgi:outer membrane immunogenic protein